MAESNENVPNKENLLSNTKESILYEVAIMCDKYNKVLYDLFSVYSKSFPNGKFQSIDDHLSFLQDYQLFPSFIEKDKAITNFMEIVNNNDNGGDLDTATFLNYEGFVEAICRIAIIVFDHPSLSKMYDTISVKISMLIEMWNLDDVSELTLHQEERKRLMNLLVCVITQTSEFSITTNKKNQF